MLGSVHTYTYTCVVDWLGAYFLLTTNCTYRALELRLGEESEEADHGEATVVDL